MDSVIPAQISGAVRPGQNAGDREDRRSSALQALSPKRVQTPRDRKFASNLCRRRSDRDGWNEPHRTTSRIAAARTQLTTPLTVKKATLTFS